MSREKDGPGGENEIAIIPGDYKLRDHLTKEILRHLVPRVTITQSRGWRRRKGKAAALLRHLFASSKQASRGEGKNRKHNSQQQRNQCPIDWVRNSLVKSAAVKTGLKGGWERRKKVGINRKSPHGFANTAENPLRMLAATGLLLSPYCIRN
ncbi:hypothetical protein NPIL_142691 [Nephila pilipes]|uniref:Uncharacterized protein n=1 Tax=Nephila pilipes TaxID=299642 RepID=A0A8X6PTB3_NEPPI|nr:hypothetical protein NPIL_142691 [Nephila pilipes]